jgi:hypothetical protein
MTTYNDAYLVWNSIIEQTISTGKPLRFKKIMNNGQPLPSPGETDPKILVKHVGEPKGQIADWRASFNNSKAGFHAVEFEDYYETHIDSVDPIKDPIEHLLKDSPRTLFGVIGVFVIGGLLFYVFTREK